MPRLFPLVLALLCVMIVGCSDENANTKQDPQQEETKQEEENPDSSPDGDSSKTENEQKKNQGVPISQLRNEFLQRLYPEIDDNFKVQKFNSKKALADDLSNVMSESLAQNYADRYFEEKNNGLYILKKRGPVTLLPNNELTIQKVDENKVRISQTNENQRLGSYKLTVTYVKRESKWIIQDRKTEKLK